MTSLHSLKKSEKGKVIRIEGGKFFKDKLESLGIYEGVIVTKKSSLLMGGPVILSVGTCEFAIGCHMAKKIILERV